MKNSLTNNDKRLLLIMFLFVIIVGIGYWGVYPQVKAFYRLGNEIDNEEIKKSVNEQKVANLGFVEAQCKEYEEGMAENKQKFFDILSEADIDLLLTGKAISHKLESFDLSIEIPDTPSDRKAYRYSELYNEQLRWESERKYESASSDTTESEIEEIYGKKSKTSEDSQEGEPISEMVDVFGNTDEIGINNDIYAARVTMTLGGEKSDLEDFLKELMESDKEILITSFSWGKYRVQQFKNDIEDENHSTTSPEYYEIIEMDSLTVTMELYMCEKE
ncbi:MAG: hypothetical protein J5840_02405 [Lachnospiraceae bacterium]|nr:hypothetical protein [Lachnospiraceae bacterium]